MEPRVVLDTGVLVIGTLVEESGSHIVLEAWRRRKLHLVISDDLLVEVRHVLRDVFHAEPEVFQNLDGVIRGQAILVRSIETITDCRDSGDNKILEAAVAGKAQYIVTFDDDLWKMSPYRGIEILTVRNFLRRTGFGPRRRRRTTTPWY